MRNPEGFMSLLLLSFVEEKPRYGYELIKEIEKESGGYWQPGQGTIYGALERLDDEGFLEEVEVEESENNNRQYYGMTEKGEEKLDELKNKCADEIKPEDRILGLMYIYRFLAGEDKFEYLLEAIEEEFF
ncbi:PadR family transcriptional regulator [Candidatus Bipolaricaulota bacterium]|nr:PadR family transcriptional regulator [Candidatus Bipolaricaulota bacterium]